MDWMPSINNFQIVLEIKRIRPEVRAYLERRYHMDYMFHAPKRLHFNYVLDFEKVNTPGALEIYLNCYHSLLTEAL